MPRYLLMLSLVTVLTAAMVSASWASGCGKDCGKNKGSRPSASGCRTMFNSGILYDDGIAITVSAPKGWVIDDKSGVPGGLHAVFYPEGSTWRNADTVMYAEIVHKDTCKNSTLEKVMQQDADEPTQSRLVVTVEDGGTYKTTKGKDAPVRLYGGGVNKAVAYVDEEKSVAKLVVSSRTGEGLKKAMPAFREFVGTYLFVSDTVDVNRNCMNGPETKAPAAKDKSLDGRRVEAKGTVSSVGQGGELLVFMPDGADREVTVRVDAGSAPELAPGDRVKVAYTEGEVNLASKVLKQHRINKLPKPCVLKH